MHWFCFLTRTRAPARVWSFVVLILCLWPGESVPDLGVIATDFVAHVVMFGILAFLWSIGTSRVWTVVLPAAFFYGIVIEILQEIPVLERQFDWLDIAANGAGALCGCGIGSRMRAVSPKKPGKT